MTRLETFADAAFAFATTMLVISTGSIPKGYQELILALKDVPAFAASFATIAWLWVMHRKWSRRYGLEDAVSTLISLGLIFVMLVYVYPLKMIFSAFAYWASGGWLPTSFVLQKRVELINLFIIYGVGFAVISFIYAALYDRALRLADQLLLNPLEKIKTKMEIGFSTILALTGLASAIFAWLTPLSLGVFAGFMYMTLPVSMSMLGARYSKKLKTFEVA